MSQSARHEYLLRMKHRYKRAGKGYRTRLLDEDCEVCEYERKYASKLLSGDRKRGNGRRGRKGYYTNPALLEALKNIGKQSEYLCGKRLQPGMALWLRDYDKHFNSLEGHVRAQLMDMSAATIDRLLRPSKAQLGRNRNSGTKPGSITKNQIRVRTVSRVGPQVYVEYQ